VDRVMVDLGDFDYTLASDAWRSTKKLPFLHKYTAGDYYVPACISSMFKPLRWIDLATVSGGISIGPSPYGYADLIGVSKDTATDATDLKTLVTGQTLVYELATPQTYHLTPTQVRTLVGNNNIWADTGDIIEGKYFKSLT